MKVLITSGGTIERIDHIRSISNHSTGRTAAVLAEGLHSRGVDVHLLHSSRAQLPEISIKRTSFLGSSDLDERIHEILSTDPSVSAVVHCAAVSDYAPVSVDLPDGRELTCPWAGKLPSSFEGFSIRFTKTKKIIDRLKSYAQECRERTSELLVIGFKYTATSDASARAEAVAELISRGTCDMVIANDASEISKEGHIARWYDKEGIQEALTMNKEQMAQRLYVYLKEQGVGI